MSSILNISTIKCPMCGGNKSEGTTTFTTDLGFGVVVVRDVPASVCTQCGADWIQDEVAEHLESIVKNARQKHHQIEVMTFA